MLKRNGKKQGVIQQESLRIYLGLIFSKLVQCTCFQIWTCHNKFKIREDNK